MTNIRLESLWSSRLRCTGWSGRAAKQVTFSIAESTLKTYNSCVNKYVSFCNDKQEDFADEHNTALLADFLCQIADSSDRPEAILKSSLAAITFLFEGLGKKSPAYHSDIKRFTSAVVKTGTFKPMSRQKPMPIEKFVGLFHL